MLGVKLNASDYVQGGLTEDDALEQVRVIAGLQTDNGQTSVDFIEVSGGDYETPGKRLFILGDLGVGKENNLRQSS